MITGQLFMKLMLSTVGRCWYTQPDCLPLSDG